MIAQVSEFLVFPNENHTFGGVKGKRFQDMFIKPMKYQQFGPPRSPGLEARTYKKLVFPYENKHFSRRHLERSEARIHKKLVFP